MRWLFRLDLVRHCFPRFARIGDISLARFARRETRQRDERVVLRRIGENLAGFHLVDPTVQRQLAPLQFHGDSRMRLQVFNLNQHMFPHGDVQQFIAREFVLGIVLGDDQSSRFGMIEPAPHEWQAGHIFRVQHGMQSTTTRMPADDDVLDSQCRHGIFDRRWFAAVGGAVARDDVPRVAQDEQFTELRLSND